VTAPFYPLSKMLQKERFIKLLSETFIAKRNIALPSEMFIEQFCYVFCFLMELFIKINSAKLQFLTEMDITYPPQIFFCYALNVLSPKLLYNFDIRFQFMLSTSQSKQCKINVTTSLICAVFSFHVRDLFFCLLIFHVYSMYVYGDLCSGDFK